MIFLSILFFIASLLQLLLGLTKVLYSGPLIDFSAFYINTRLFLTGGNPYALPHPFNYPPAILLFFAPLAVFPVDISQIIFTLISLIALFVSILITLRLFSKSWPLFFLVTAITLQSFPVKFTLSMGQVNLFVLMFAVFSFYFDQKNRSKFAGMFFALSIILKITPITLGLFFLVRKRYKTLIWGAAIFILSNLFLIYFRGWTSTYFLTAVPNFFLNLDNSTSLYDQSLRALFSRLGLESFASLLSMVIVFLMFLYAIVIYLKRIRVKNLSTKLLIDLNFFSLILVITTIGNSYAWQHHFVLLIPGYIVAIANFLNSWKRQRHLGGGRMDSPEVEGLEKRWIIRGFLLLISFLLVSYHFPNTLNPPTFNPFLISHTLIGALVVVGLLLTG